MYINYQQLIRLPVITKSGEKLGYVHDVEIDIKEHFVRKYLVVHGIVSRDTFLITPAQIIEINKDNIVVEDNILKVEAESKKRIARPALDAPFSTIVKDE